MRQWYEFRNHIWQGSCSQYYIIYNLILFGRRYAATCRTNINLSGTTELENEEVRRAKAQERYMVLERYWTSLAGMAQVIVNPNAPPAIKQFYITASQKAEKEMEKILQDMDMMNAEDAVMSLDEFPGMKEMAGQPNMPIQPGGQQGQQGQQQGNPGQQ